MIDQFGIGAVDANGDQPDLSTIGQGPAHDMPDQFKSVTGLANSLSDYVRSFWLEAEDAVRNDSDRSFMPMLLAVCANGDVAPIGVGISMDENTKDMFVSKMREMFKTWGVVRYGFVSECWVATYQGTPDQPGRIMPSEHPDREEIMSIVVADLEGTVEARVLKMVRDEKGIVSDLILDEEKSKMSGGNGTSFGGRFASLLKEGEHTTDAHSTSAVEMLAFVERVLTVPEAMRNVFGDEFDSLQADGLKILTRIRATVAEFQAAEGPAETIAQMKLNALMAEVQGFMMRIKAIWQKSHPETDPDDTGVRH